MRRLSRPFLLLLVFLLATMVATEEASASAIQIRINGFDHHYYEQSPFIHQGRALLPLRAICQDLGAQVDWHAESRTAHIQCDGNTLVFPQGVKRYTVNGVNRPLDVPLLNRAGHFYIPVRHLAEALGMDVRWDGPRFMVHIDTGARPFSDPRYTPGDAILGDWGIGENYAEVLHVISGKRPGDYEVAVFATHEGAITPDRLDAFFPRHEIRPDMLDGMRWELRYRPESNDYAILGYESYSFVSNGEPDVVYYYGAARIDYGRHRKQPYGIVRLNDHHLELDFYAEPGKDYLKRQVRYAKIDNYSPEAQAAHSYVRAAYYWLKQ